MTIGQEFLKEVDAELKATRRLVERMPSDKGRWKPHPKSSALGHLTQLVCRMPRIMSDIVNGIDLDLAAGPDYSFETTEVLLREFDANVAAVKATLAAANDAHFDGAWNVRAGDEVYDTAGRKDALRNTIKSFCASSRSADSLLAAAGRAPSAAIRADGGREVIVTALLEYRATSCSRPEDNNPSAPTHVT